MESLVSVIVPVYNSENFLERCVDSIVNQTYRNLEIILVDDGSSDNSGRICDYYVDKDKRVKVIHKDNRGQSSARNVGIRNANGEYLSFIDSDDIVQNDFIEYLFDLISRETADMAICHIAHFNEGDKIQFTNSDKFRILDSNKAISEMLYQHSWLESPCNKLYAKKVFGSLQFDESKIFEDSLLMPTLFEQCSKIVYGKAEKYAYIHRKNSTTTSKYSKKQLDILKVTDILYEKYKDSDLKLAALSYKMSANLRVYLNAPDTKEFSTEIQQCHRFIKDNTSLVLKDKMVRRKTKISLLFFKLGRKSFLRIYQLINCLTHTIKNG